MAGRQRAARRIVACGTMARERYDAALNFSLKGKNSAAAGRRKR
jgi:hypothetical protein